MNLHLLKKAVRGCGAKGALASHQITGRHLTKEKIIGLSAGLALVASLLMGCATASEPAEAPSAAPSGSGAPAAAAEAPRPTSTPIRAGAPPALPTPRADAIRIEGNGSGQAPCTLSQGEKFLTATHDGDWLFQVNIIDSAGRRHFFVNEVGKFSDRLLFGVGSRPLDLPPGECTVEVEMVDDGAWTLAI